MSAEPVPDGNQLSNMVVYDVGSPCPPQDAIQFAYDWLHGRIDGEYPCMDCGPNVRLAQDDDGNWGGRVEHDTTCPTKRGIVPRNVE